MFQQTAEGVIILLYVQPQAPKSEVIGPYNGALKIKIKAPPTEGKANDEIIRFLSELTGLAKSKIEILKGDKSRNKKILIRQALVQDLQSLFR